ncbi:MAG TPA: GNAT family N-acetyltransferase [Candidatus Acidoferrales bacterium]|nr:GNAT family N-acetyltransferase [Candidatus Acidoferrales bacterium]
MKHEAMRTDLKDVAIERATGGDVEAIVKLAQENGPDRGGELSVRLTSEAVAARMQKLPNIVARRGCHLIGFLLTSERTATASPIVSAMLKTYPGSERAYVYGPVCVAAGERGRGIAAAMFAELRRLLPHREGILFIKTNNHPSLRAHRKMGMRPVGEFTHDGVDLAIFSYTG